MGKTIRASALILLLACTAQAGWIQNGSPEPAPEPAPTPTSEPAYAVGYMEEGSSGLLPVNSDQASATNGYIQSGASDALSEAVLTVLNGVLALL